MSEPVDPPSKRDIVNKALTSIYSAMRWQDEDTGRDCADAVESAMDAYATAEVARSTGYASYMAIKRQHQKEQEMREAAEAKLSALREAARVVAGTDADDDDGDVCVFCAYDSVKLRTPGVHHAPGCALITLREALAVTR